MTTDVVDAPEIDTEQMSTDLAADLGLNLDTSNREPEDALDTDTLTVDSGRDASGRFAKPADPAAAPAADPAATPGVDDLPVPKSWAKEMHPIWDKLSKGVPLNAEESKSAAKYYNQREKQMEDGARGQNTDAEYGRTLRGVIGRHEDILRSQGLDGPTAVDYLFNAHRELSNPNKAAAQDYLVKVAAKYGLQLGASAAADPNAPTALPPEVKELQTWRNQVEQERQQERARQYEQVKQATASEVETFASDPKNQYFDECADHICVLLKGDPSMKLATAYETAVWANPVTRQKELARIQQETDKANRERAAAAAKAAKKGTSTNVKGRDTARAPTAPAASLANLDDVMRESYDEIKSKSD